MGVTTGLQRVKILDAKCLFMALFGSAAMSELSPLCAPKRTSANTYGFMGKHLVVPQFLAFKLLKEIS
jgi:hypothetical protein